MANMFALILVIATLVTGILWCINLFKINFSRRLKSGGLLIQTSKVLEKQSLKSSIFSWYESLITIFPVLALVLIIRSFIYEPFQIPSGSVMPTLFIGDFILVEKFAYGLKEPLTQQTLIPTGHPKHGDLVVFKYPLDPSLDYIKRVIGLPGDKVTYNPYSKELTVSSAIKSSESCNQILPINYTKNEPSEWIQAFEHNNGINRSVLLHRSVDRKVKDGYRMNERQEILGTVVHRILTMPDVQDVTRNYYRQPGQPYGVWIVPKGCYFMMGDNRDNSSDSRYWGFVPERNLVGRATAIWMSFEKQEGQWPTKLRLNRIGSIE
ncbi:signal peptidase I [Candidatus Profftia tarda]|uniref:Signal peptidase I n=1 Tax=Candidatus Profftia tarda TaxID=1177216 RepID=A0A8E4F170_9ENTR|nr:signal peptidase I [Candidatus Profftia tarda]CAD6506922.1 Signal peptidase I [Candidatus Profftia tarda]